MTDKRHLHDLMVTMRKALAREAWEERTQITTPDLGHSSPGDAGRVTMATALCGVRPGDGGEIEKLI